MNDFTPVHIVGGGLAGCEAAFQLASNGVPAVIHEMRPIRKTEAHQGGGLAELVCSNSFRSDDATANAVGVLHQEMRLLGSLIMTDFIPLPIFFTFSFFIIFILLSISYLFNQPIHQIYPGFFQSE